MFPKNVKFSARFFEQLDEAGVYVAQKYSDWQTKSEQEKEITQLRKQREIELRKKGMNDKAIQEALEFEYGQSLISQIDATGRILIDKTGEQGNRMKAITEKYQDLNEKRQGLLEDVESGLRDAEKLARRQKMKKTILGWLAIVLGIIDILLLIGRIKRIFS